MRSRALYALPAIILALLALVLAAIGFLKDPPRAGAMPAVKTSAGQSQQRPAPLFEYLVVTRSIASGEIISEDQVSPVSTVEQVPDAIPANDFNYDARATAPIAPGALITRARLTSTSVLAPRLKAGHQAIALPLDEVSGVGGLLKPGDRVDVIATLKRDRSDTPSAVVVLHSAPVLAVKGDLGGDTDVGEEQRRNDSIVLLVPNDRAPAVLLASNEGKIRLSAVQPDARETVTGSASRAVELADLFPRPPAPPKKAAPVSRRTANQVQVFEGSDSRKVYVR